MKFGFSTGCIKYGGVFKALEQFSRRPAIKSVELSALRMHEFAPMMDAIPQWNLGHFDYVSFHAPSEFDTIEELRIATWLREDIMWRRWPIILHPDTIHDFGPWRDLGESVCIENMDNRKSFGRDLPSLKRIFIQLPEASFCLDIGHAHQMRNSLVNARTMIEQLPLKQVHLSHVDLVGHHGRLDPVMVDNVKRMLLEVRNVLPDDLTIILETPVTVDEIDEELAIAQQLFNLES